MIGGLGSAVAEVLSEADCPKVPFKRLGLPSEFSTHIGSQGYLLAQHGLNDEGVPRAVQGILAASTGRT